MSLDFSALNKEQKLAVQTTEGPLLVLAGAGTGKTRVLTYRIANLILNEGIAPWQILAITFTNKAAREMKDRLASLLQGSMRGMWVMTFHAMCVRMLRTDAELVGYKPNFTIYDDSDSKRLVKEIMAQLNLDAKRYPMNAIRSMISQAKNNLMSPKAFEQELARSSDIAKAASLVYAHLQARLKAANAMDFDDLLMQSYYLLRDNESVLESYQERFTYISVDEYQDTNKAQYALVKLLSAKYQNIMVVGDDDQSIYSWRGADISNILGFEEDYPKAQTIKLEQNYRSTSHILNAANAVVANNVSRKEKKLYTNLGEGEKIHLYQASDERDEGSWIASQIERLLAQGSSYREMAVFYRTNAQSRVLEDMFLRAGVSYKIVGGVRFFDRAEIRDVISYLKAAINPEDDMAIKRIINTPRRGIGDATIGKIEKDASDDGVSFYSAVQMAVANDVVYKTNTRNKLAHFMNIIEHIRHLDGELRNIVDEIISASNLIGALELEHTQEADSRIENIKEFLTVVEDFTQMRYEELALEREEQDAFDLANKDDERALEAIKQDEAIQTQKGSLEDFVEWLALRSDLDSLSGNESYVTMMTVHAAKGLEFPIVFVAGMEDYIFPHSSALNDPLEMEEERRLAYVAITRAMSKLYLSYATVRHAFGSSQSNPRSRFLSEIPEEDLLFTGTGSSSFSGTGWEKRGDRHGTFGSGVGSEMYGGKVYGAQTRSSGGSKRQAPSKQAVSTSYELGDKISHKTFGKGVVLEVKGDTLSVRFEKTGQTKKLMLGFAPIVKINE
ncbi:MAG: UvrD-helicase domain-containing protein [Coriobacteriia bacterium]|nr:UvrD-helicase domain-containing protein [Coriobacteriia bacterium]